MVRWLTVPVLLIALAACGTPPSSETAASSSPVASAAPSDATAASPSPEASPAASASPEPSEAASPAASEAASSAPDAKSAYAVGETADLAGVKVTLNEVTVQEPTEFFKPDAGKKFLIVNATVENTTAAEVNVSSALQMELQDESGQTYGIDIMATAARNQSSEKTPDGAIPPGEKLRGNVGYQVPEDAAGLRWIYKEVFGSDRVVFEVNP